MLFSPGHKVLLSHHRGYPVWQSAVLQKSGIHYAGPFNVVERIGRSVYKLEFPRTWRIHDVVSVSHLVPVRHRNHRIEHFEVPASARRLVGFGEDGMESRPATSLLLYITQVQATTLQSTNKKSYGVDFCGEETSTLVDSLQWALVEIRYPTVVVTDNLDIAQDCAPSSVLPKR